MPGSPATPLAPRRARGRPRRLEPDAVLEAALALLGESGRGGVPAGDFTLGRLAARLEVPVSSLYTYFPNRDALLEAAAERVFARFDWQPREGAAAAETLLSWMLALAGHFERYPLTQQLLSWERRVSPAWLRVMAPIASLLHAEGLRGQALATCFGWFINGTIGLIDAHGYNSRQRPMPPSAHLDLQQNSAADIEAQLELWRHAASVDHHAVLEAGFRALVDGVTHTIAAAREGAAASRPDPHQQHTGERA